MKLWAKDTSLSGEIEKFTIGMDQQLDLLLAPYDVLGSMAHAQMLKEIGLINAQEWSQLQAALVNIYRQIEEGEFVIGESVEDVHSQVEFMLTERLGEVGKKIHSGRSRNDQVLLDLKLFLRDQIKTLSQLVGNLVEALLDLSELHKEVIIPGYTHMQAAMPSSFGLWFGAYAETFVDDLKILKASFDIVNQNPLGSAAGFGNSFPLDRKLTTELLGFQDLHVNSVAAQMSRGKTEAAVAFSISSLCNTLGRMAMDICLYNSQNFGFLSFPESITTGSSIMPHKKNPDVFELIRARCNHLQTLPQQIQAVLINLPSGYHRDLQLTKELLLPSLDHASDCFQIISSVISQMKVNKRVIDDPRYELIYSVENVNQQVLSGKSFRDAYRHIAENIANNNFTAKKEIEHTHLGSIGNLGTEEIREKLNKTQASFNFETYQKNLQQLIETK